MSRWVFENALQTEWKLREQMLRERDEVIARLETELATYKPRKPRSGKKHGATGEWQKVPMPPREEGAEGGYVVSEGVATKLIATDRQAPPNAKGSSSDTITKAIRSVAGNDRPLARHLRQFANDQIANDVPVREIVRAIHRGQSPGAL